MKKYIKSSMDKLYTEYNETGDLIRKSYDLEMLIEDVSEFGGCVVGPDGEFAGGFEWVYDEQFGCI